MGWKNYRFALIINRVGKIQTSVFNFGCKGKGRQIICQNGMEKAKPENQSPNFENIELSVESTRVIRLIRAIRV